MGDDTPQQIIDAEKRKLQTQAYVGRDYMEPIEVVQGVEGGETPVQAASKLDDMARETRISQKSVVDRFTDLTGLNEFDGANVVRLVGEGQITLSDSDTQAAAMDVFKLKDDNPYTSMHKLIRNPESSVGASVMEDAADKIGEEFPEARRAGPAEK
jgi:AraC-like DNA-binding protein